MIKRDKNGKPDHNTILNKVVTVLSVLMLGMVFCLVSPEKAMANTPEIEIDSSTYASSIKNNENYAANSVLKVTGSCTLTVDEDITFKSIVVDPEHTFTFTIRINDGKTLNVTEVISGGQSSIVINGGTVNTQVLEGSDITIKGGTVNAISNLDGNSGIHADGKLTIEGSNTSVHAKGSGSEGAVYASSGIVINSPLKVQFPVGGTVSADNDNTVIVDSKGAVAHEVKISSAVTGVSVSPAEITLKPGETKQLTATVVPDNVSNKNVTWSSGNESIARVDSDGKVTAIAEGEATITVTTEDSGKTATCKVTVSKDAPVMVTVTFDANGHGRAPETQTIARGEKVNEPKDPSAEGYQFEGWYTESRCKKRYDFDTQVTDSFTLYAKWSDDEDDSDNDSSSSGFNPDVLTGVYDAASNNTLLLKQEQGFLAKIAFNAGMPAGYREAFTYSMFVNGKADYSLKTGKVVLTIPEQYRKAGRTFALLGLNRAGKVICFTDTDSTDNTLTTNLNLEGYAFMLVYHDTVTQTAGTAVATTNDVAQTAQTYTIKTEESVIKKAEKSDTSNSKYMNKSISVNKVR